MSLQLFNLINFKTSIVKLRFCVLSFLFAMAAWHFTNNCAVVNIVVSVLISLLFSSFGWHLQVSPMAVCNKICDLIAYLTVRKHQSRGSFQIISEIDRFIHCIITRYIESWYVCISDNPLPINDCRVLIRGMLIKLMKRLASVDQYKMTSRAICLYKRHLEVYCKVKHSSLGDNIVETAMKTTNVPHPNIGKNELSHLTLLSDFIIATLCNTDEQDMPLFRELLAQILANKVLLHLINHISQPDWLFHGIILVLNVNSIQTMDNSFTEQDVSAVADTEVSLVSDNSSSDIVCGHNNGQQNNDGMSSDRNCLDVQKTTISDGYSENQMSNSDSVHIFQQCADVKSRTKFISRMLTAEGEQTDVQNIGVPPMEIDKIPSLVFLKVAILSASDNELDIHKYVLYTISVRKAVLLCKHF